MRNPIFFAITALSMLLATSPLSALPQLSASGTHIVDSAGNTVVLRGINLGGAFEVEPWMSALNLSSPPAGYPQIQDEVTLWSVLSQRFGAAQMQQLQQTWRSSWLTPADIANVAALGGNVVRIPFFYQLVQSDSNPGQLIPSGVALLDALVDACAQAGVYAILDLHGAPGGQSSNLTTGETNQNQLFASAAWQQQTVQLWSLLAAHYQNHPEVAGYDLINEPSGATPSGLISLYDSIYKAIRAVDPNHMIIMEDGYLGLSIFPTPAKMNWSNICYSLHLYHLTALTAAPFQNDINSIFPVYQAELAALNTPFYIGEFSTEGAALSRGTALGILPQYLSGLDATGWSWTPWTYKYFDATNGASKIWGVYVNSAPWNEPDPYNDSFSTLQQKFAAYNTANIGIQSDYSAVLKAGLTTLGSGPAPVISAIQNSGDFQPGTAAATWTTIYGSNLSQVTRSWQTSDFNGNLLPTSLNGVSVSINGVPAYVSYISSTQINVLAPDDGTVGAVTVQVTNSAGSASASVQKSAFSPAFFTFGSDYAAAEHANGTLIAPAGLIPGSVATPAAPGETIEVYGTGFGPTSPPWPTSELLTGPLSLANPVTLSVGGVVSNYIFEGLVGPGLYQFNVTIPPGTPNGDATLIATIQGQSAPPVKITVQQQ
jgi:endoglucanase